VNPVASIDLISSKKQVIASDLANRCFRHKSGFSRFRRWDRYPVQKVIHHIQISADMIVAV
jgi:hypothetical protein